VSTNLLAFVTAALGHVAQPCSGARLGAYSILHALCWPYADRKSLLLYGVNLQIVSRFGTEESEVQILSPDQIQLLN
jgi:hypothetical protein